MYGISSPARPTAPTPRRSASCRRRTCRGQGEPRDDLAVAVVLAGRHEPEPLAEPGGPLVLRRIAGTGRSSPATNRPSGYSPWRPGAPLTTVGEGGESKIRFNRTSTLSG